VERYLPRAVRDVQADGLELPVGVHELSTLFVDLRGYSTFAEGRAPKEIFATISSYTRRASAIIRRHGGCVVEFNGDGLMALFGCPRPLANKERAAVLAALALVKAFGPANRAARRRSCEVGVGIATGEIYVGTIGWRDQAVWSATGNATILAARLQVATRSLHASIAIDARTFERAGDVGARFRKRPRLPIRGRTRPEDVFIVERPPPEAAQSSRTRTGRSGGTSRALAPTPRTAHESA
jgi:adenylate cyclase